MIPMHIPSWPLIAVPGQQLLQSPSSLLLLLAVLAVTALLYLERPRINRRTILLLVPWMVAAATLPILGRIGAYPDAVRPLVNAAGAPLSTYFILGVAWFAMIELTVESDAQQILPDYLGSMGIGLATVLTTLVLLRGEPASIAHLGWSVLILFGVAVFSIAVVFLLGFWYVEAPTHTGAVGMLAVFGQTLDGVTRSVGIGMFEIGHHSLLSWRILDLIAALQPDVPPEELLLSWTTTYVWLKIAVAVFAVILLAQYTERSPQRSYLVLGGLAALGITAGMTNLLRIAIGGVP